MTPSLPDFVAHWKASELTERAASQNHFNEICDLVGHPHPTQVDLTGESFTFDKHLSKDRGGKGFATSGCASILPGVQGANTMT